MTPYLVQRGRLRENKDRKGLDALIAFDYMGSSEFEFGALNKSLKAIRAELKFYQNQTVYFENAGAVTIFAKDISDATEAIRGLSKRAYRLKEYCDFFDWCNPAASLVLKKESRANFWWDIENHFMFWLSQKPNNENILAAIRGET